MKKFDSKHIAFHVLAALYFIWLPLFAVFLSMFAYYFYIGGETKLNPALLPGLFINLIMGAMLMFVLRMFRNLPKTTRFVKISYYTMLCFSIVLLFIIYFV